MQAPILLATQAYQYLLNDVVRHSEQELALGKLTIKDFPDGEHYHRIDSDINGRAVVIIGGTIDDAATMELFDLAQGCIQYGAQSLTLIIPYFGYATMERSVQHGEIVKAKNRALLFSAIPATAMGNKVLLFDLHAEGIPYYFNSDVRPFHIYTKPIIAQIATNIAGNDFVLAATDAGRAKWVESLANDLGVTGAFVYKKRWSGATTELTAINAPVENQTVIIYDDMIRTGGSLLNAAKAYKDAGAAAIYVITTHGLFTNHAMDKIAACGFINEVHCLNTHPLCLVQQHPLLKVHSIAPLLLTFIQTDSGK